MSVQISFNMYGLTPVEKGILERAATAVMSGSVTRLDEVLGKVVKPFRKRIVSTLIDGTTLLIMACQYGHVILVEYLIKNCSADIEQVGRVTFDQETIEGAPPLWCAAAAGELLVVELLLTYKANVNCLTKSHSTPLRAACYDGYLNIVRYLIESGADIEIANQYGHTCLMIACFRGHLNVVFYLLQCGADVNKESLKGNTALHDAAESNNVRIMKHLLMNGAEMVKNANGMTPLLTAAHAASQSIVEFLLKLGICSWEEKVNSLELLGAAYMDQQQDMVAALRCWRRSFHLRNEHPEISFESNFTSYIHPHISVKSVNSLEELEEVALDPDYVKIYSLVVRERILGPSNSDTVYYIRIRGTSYGDKGNVNMCLKLWLYSIDILQGTHKSCDPVTVSNFMSFLDLFIHALKPRPNEIKKRAPFEFSDWFSVFERICKELASAQHEITPDDEQRMELFHYSIVIAMNILAQFHETLVNHTNEEAVLLDSLLQKLIARNLCGSKGETVLHMVCRSGYSSLPLPPTLFPSCSAAKLLLDAGASPNAIDNDHNTPLHLVAQGREGSKSSLFKLLLDYGAHLDLCNKDGKTALELTDCPEQLNLCKMRYLSLKCLCAQRIRKSKIEYHDMLLHHLEAFLDRH